MYVLGKSYILITSGNQRVKLPVYFSPRSDLQWSEHAAQTMSSSITIDNYKVRNPLTL